MKAIVLAAGFGTRLKPITNSTPKCLVPIKNKPLLEYWLENLTNNGVESILINTHYLSEKVENYIINSKYKDNCKLVYENVLLGTAGTLISNFNFIGQDECILIHADNYCITDLSKLINAHTNRQHGSLLTMMTFKTNNPESCGIVEINQYGIVENFHEKIKNPPGNLANGAVYILSVEFLNILKSEYSFAKEFTTEILPNFFGKIHTYETKEIFLDIGTPENYYLANNML
jgi:mannose-1-phosphate guanylyltransferase